MMTNRDMQVMQELKQRISQVAQLIEIRAFGSRARGDNADEYSDLDVFIEVEHLDSEIEEKIQHIAWDVGFNHDCMCISPLLFSRDEIENSPLRSSDIVRNIRAEGIYI